MARDDINDVMATASSAASQAARLQQENMLDQRKRMYYLQDKFVNLGKDAYGQYQENDSYYQEVPGLGQSPYARDAAVIQQYLWEAQDPLMNVDARTGKAKLNFDTQQLGAYDNYQREMSNYNDPENLDYRAFYDRGLREGWISPHSYGPGSAGPYYHRTNIPRDTTGQPTWSSNKQYQYRPRYKPLPNLGPNWQGQP